MATAVSLWFDEALERAIRALWREVAEAGITNHLHLGPYRPHVTLGVWENAGIEELAAALAAPGAAFAKLPLHFEQVGLFADPARVVYLTPKPRPALAALQARVHARVREHVSGPLRYTRPPEWTPHCTIASQLSDATHARECIRIAANHLPLRGEGAALGIIDTPAEIELRRIPLAAPGGIASD